MKALALKPKQAETLDLIDLEKPRISQDEVLIKTLSTSIDRTDLDIYVGLYGKEPEGEDRLIIGHEAVGKVIEVGKNIIGFKAGDFVVPTVRRTCGDCDICVADEPDMCRRDDYKERGIVKAHGFMSEYFKDAPENLVKIPKELVSVGSLIEPMSVAQKAVSSIYKIQKRFSWRPESALVLGAGSLGLLSAVILARYGLQTFAYDIVSENSVKAQIAKMSGATYIDGRDLELDEFANNYGKPDLIIEATGNSSVAFDAMDIIATNGIMCLLSISAGSHEETICPDCLNNDLVLGNKVVFGSVSSNRSHFEKAVEVARESEKKSPGLLSRIMTDKLKFEDFRRAFEAKDNSHIKSVIYFE